MKEQNDTGWKSLIDKALSEKPVDNLEETNPELSKYSSISTLRNIWPANHLRQRKDCQKVSRLKRHRFPPSLLASKAADFWQTLLPLRVNCSCSSLSVSDKCTSRSSFGSSSPEENFSSLDSSISPVKEFGARETLGDTLEHTCITFKVFIDRMVKLVNIPPKTSESSSNHVFSGSNLQIYPSAIWDQKLNENLEIVDEYRPQCEIFATQETEKASQSLSKLEIAEQKRRMTFSTQPTLREVTRSALTKEELFYFLEYKKTLLSEYFQLKADSADLKKNLDTSDQKAFVYGTQSDSRLREDNLLQFVQFIRARRKNETGRIPEKNSISSSESVKLQTKLTTSIPSVNKKERDNLVLNKRRVTFSNPLAVDSTTALNSYSSDSVEDISSELSFTTSSECELHLTSSDEKLYIESPVVSPCLDSLVPFEEPFVTPTVSLNSLSSKAGDSGSKIIMTEAEITMTEVENHSDESIDVSSNTPGKNFDSRPTENLEEPLEVNDEAKPRRLGFLMEKILDSGTTHEPGIDEAHVGNSRKMDNKTPRFTFEETSPQQNGERRLKRKIRQMKIAGRYSILDEDENSNCAFENESMCRSKMIKFSNVENSETRRDKRIVNSYRSSENQQSSETDSDECSYSRVPSPKTVTFQDHCCKAMISDQSIASDTEQSEDKSDMTGRYEFTFKGCWVQQVGANVIQGSDNLIIEDPTKDEDFRLFELNTPKVPVDDDKNSNQSEPLMGLGIHEGLRNPEIWRADITSQPTIMSESGWCLGYNWDRNLQEKTGSKKRSDWLMRKLEELRLGPDTDHESDCYVDSDMESYSGCEKSLSVVKKSISNIDFHSENRGRFNMKRGRLGPNLFLQDDVWSGKKIFINECRCHKNPPSNRARLLLDSETEESGFSPSIQPEFPYDFTQNDDHINKIKCRRFVNSPKSIESGLGVFPKQNYGQFSSNKPLKMTFKKSFISAGVHSVVSTRNVGTSVSDKQHRCYMMDVSIDTVDLCPCKSTETEHHCSESIFTNSEKGCQTQDLFRVSRNSFERAADLRKPSLNFNNANTSPQFNLQIDKNDGQYISNTIANLATEINDASNNLARLRFCEIETTRANVDSNYLLKGRFQNGTKSAESPLQFSNLARPMEISEKNCSLPAGFSSSAREKSTCPICNNRNKPTGRYVLPACIVKGGVHDQRKNEKDPWNRVMERAKVQHRYELRNSSVSLEAKPFVRPHLMSPTSTSIVYSEDLESRQNFLAGGSSHEEKIKMQIIQVENDSSQVSPPQDYILKMEKIPSAPLRQDRPRRSLSSHLCPPTPSNFSTSGLPRNRSPKRIRRPQTMSNMSNRLLYIISERAELSQQMPVKIPAGNFCT